MTIDGSLDGDAGCWSRVLPEDTVSVETKWRLFSALARSLTAQMVAWKSEIQSGL